MLLLSGLVSKAMLISKMVSNLEQVQRLSVCERKALLSSWTLGSNDPVFSSRS